MLLTLWTLNLLILLHYIVKCSKISKKAIEKEEYGNNKILIICSLVFIFVIHETYVRNNERRNIFFNCR